MSKKFAVVVGIDKYEKVSLKNLKFCSLDAIEFANSLVSYCNYKPNQVKLFADNSDIPSQLCINLPNRSDILSAVKLMCSMKANTILFYFSGHGNNNYLINNDTRLNIVEETAISIHKINQLFENSTANIKLRFFDACRNEWDMDSSKKGAQRGMSKIMAEAIFLRANGFVTFSACRTREVSYEDPKLENGVFTYYILEGLRGEAANDNGMITVSSLDDYVSMKVEEWSFQNGKRQSPQILMHKSGILEFAYLFPKATNRQKRKLANSYLEKACKCDNYQDKEKYIRSALDMNPNDIIFYETLAAVLIERKKYEEAISICKKAIKLHPTYGKIYKLLGDAFIYKNNE